MKTKKTMRSIFDALNEQLSDKNTQELIIGMPEDTGNSGDFNYNGCDLIDTLALNTEEVECLVITRNIMGRVIDTQEFKANVCHMVLDAYHNGTNYYLNERGDWMSEHDVVRNKKEKRLCE